MSSTKVSGMEVKYVFCSKRLGFRNWQVSDTKPYRALSSDAKVMRYFPKEFWLDEASVTKSINGFMDHYKKTGFTYFAVDILETGDFIGFIGMKTIAYDIFFAPAVDIGWRLAEEYWGKGYATEGALAAKEWFFKNFSETRLVSITPVTNFPSENVMKKIGMTKVCEFDHPLLASNEPLKKHVLYEIINT